MTLNGEKVEPLRWDDPSSSAFADLTDRVKYGEENRITLSIKGMAPNGFMGPFLLYPEEAATDRVLPDAGPGGQTGPLHTRPWFRPCDPVIARGRGRR